MTGFIRAIAVEWRIARLGVALNIMGSHPAGGRLAGVRS